MSEIEIEMVLDIYAKKQIFFAENLGLKPLSIMRDIQCQWISREGVRLFLKWYKETGTFLHNALLIPSLSNAGY